MSLLNYDYIICDDRGEERHPLIFRNSNKHRYWWYDFHSTLMHISRHTDIYDNIMFNPIRIMNGDDRVATWMAPAGQLGCNDRTRDKRRWWVRDIEIADEWRLRMEKMLKEALNQYEREDAIENDLFRGDMRAAAEFCSCDYTVEPLSDYDRRGSKDCFAKKAKKYFRRTDKYNWRLGTYQFERIRKRNGSKSS